MEQYTIYTLSANDGVIRYVGATARLKSRLRWHLSASKQRNAAVSVWINSLDHRPVLTPIETCDQAIWQTREQYWIAQFSQNGPLLNQTIGGKGTLGYVWTEADKRAMQVTQKRIVEALAAQGLKRQHKPPTSETRERMAAAQRGKKHSDEAKRRMSASRQNIGQETREKLALAAMERPAEWRAWFAYQQTGKPKSEETRIKMSVAAKARWARQKNG